MNVSESVLQAWLLQGGVRYLVETTEMWHILFSCFQNWIVDLGRLTKHI